MQISMRLTNVSHNCLCLIAGETAVQQPRTLSDEEIAPQPFLYPLSAPPADAPPVALGKKNLAELLHL